MSARVIVITETLRRLDTKGPFNTATLAEHIKSLAEQTDPQINADIRVSIDREISGGVMISAQIRARGDFEDQEVAEAYIDKFSGQPWGTPAALTTEYEHHKDQIVFTAYATVGQEHCV